MEANKQDLWEYHYSKNLKYVPRWPDNFAIKFFGRISKNINLKGKKALDLGFGGGKDLILIDKMGMFAFGIEVSKNAIKFAKRYIKEWNVNAKIRLYDGQKIPYPDNFFDYIISLGVLDHIKFLDAISLKNEIYRAIKPKGYLCISLHSVRDSNFRKGREIERNTFVIETGNYELGSLQHYYDEEEILKLFDNFKIQRVFLEEESMVNLKDKNLINTSSFWVIYAQK